MPVPVFQALKIGSYIFRQKMKGNKRYPLVMMLEPLFRCNLECIGCGKIQKPNEILKQNMSPEKCFKAAKECGAPIVSIAGGEPLMHPDIVEIVEGLIKQKRFIYLCTNAILLKDFLDRLPVSPYLTLSVHLDGMEEDHDRVVDQKGTFKLATEAVIEAKKKGFRVTSATTFFEDTTIEKAERFLDFLKPLVLMELPWPLLSDTQMHLTRIIFLAERKLLNFLISFLKRIKMVVGISIIRPCT